MRKYRVTIPEFIIEVETESEDEAIEMARDALADAESVGIDYEVTDYKVEDLGEVKE